MLLRDLGRVAAELGESPVFADSLWDTEASEATRMDLVMFHARMTSHGLGRQALEALELLQGEAISAVAMGRLRQVGFLGFEPARRTFSTDDLIAGLGRLPALGRQAALYALEAGCSPREVENLCWRDVLKASNQTPLMVEVIRQRNMIRHIRLPHVFWHAVTERIDGPLQNLQGMIEGAFERSWHLLAADYRNILVISQRAELDSFQAVTRNAQ